MHAERHLALDDAASTRRKRGELVDDLGYTQVTLKLHTRLTCRLHLAEESSQTTLALASSNVSSRRTSALSLRCAPRFIVSFLTHRLLARCTKLHVGLHLGYLRAVPRLPVGLHLGHLRGVPRLLVSLHLGYLRGAPKLLVGLHSAYVHSVPSYLLAYT